MLNNIQPNLQHRRAKPGWADYRCVNRCQWTVHTRGKEGDKEEDTEKDKRPEWQTCKLFLSDLRGSHQIKEAFQDWRVWAKKINIDMNSQSCWRDWLNAGKIVVHNSQCYSPSRTPTYTTDLMLHTLHSSTYKKIHMTITAVHSTKNFCLAVYW